MANLVKIWPILVGFTMTSHLLFSNYVTMVVNFEEFLTLPGFLLIRKSHQLSKSYGHKTEGVPSIPPPLDRIGLNTEHL